MRARVLTIALLAIILALPLVVEREAAYRLPSGASPLNTGLEGTSDLVEALSERGFRAVIVSSWSSDLKRLEPCLIVVVSPESPYSDRELRTIRELAASGVNVLVADDGVYSNAVLESLGVPARVSSRAVLAGSEPVFSAATRVGGVELKVVYAYPSAVDAWGEVEVMARAESDVLAVAYDAGAYRVVVVGDGTVFTNALIRPRNALNHNFMFSLLVVESLCPAGAGAVLVEGSKYPSKPPPLAGAEAPLAAYLIPAGKILGVLLLVLVASRLAPPGSRPTARGAAEWRRAPEAYEAAKLICEDGELSRVFLENCRLFAKTRKARQLLNAVAAAAREDRGLADELLRVLLERRGQTEAGATP